MEKSKKKKLKVRDEVMLEHLTKTFNCGPHKDKRKASRQQEKIALQKDLMNNNS